MNKKLCPSHQKCLGCDACTEGFVGCEFEDAREEEVKAMEDGKLYCPVCNHLITDMEAMDSNPCEHVMATYVDLCGMEFVHVHDDFRSEAQEMEIRANDWYHPEGEVSLDYLMHKYVDSHEGYVMIELTTTGMACGPTSSSEYHIIRK